MTNYRRRVPPEPRKAPTAAEIREIASRIKFQGLTELEAQIQNWSGWFLPGREAPLELSGREFEEAWLRSRG